MTTKSKINSFVGRIAKEDSLEFLKRMPDKSVNLFAFDPFYDPDGKKYEMPDYNKLAKISPILSNRIRAFSDDVNMSSYLYFIASRIAEMHRILDDEGSIWFHCDPKASHYIKMILDTIFGRNHFRNEIIWGYTGPGSPKMRQFNRKHDTIFWYSKSDVWTFNGDDVRIDHKGDGPHTGGFNGSIDKKEAAKYAKKGKIPETHWIQEPGNGLCIAARSKQYLDYPMQKPEALLERIIKATSNPGQIICDPFCGSGTTLAVAEQLGRQWIGCDSDEEAYTIAIRRLGLENQVIADEIRQEISEARKKNKSIDVENFVRKSMKKRGLEKYGYESWIDYKEWGVEVVQACHLLAFSHKGKAIITWNGLPYDLTKEPVDFRHNLDNIIMQSMNRHESFDRYITSYDPKTGKPVYSKKQEHAPTVKSLKDDESKNHIDLTEGQKKFMQWHFDEFCRRNPEFDPKIDL